MSNSTPIPAEFSTNTFHNGGFIVYINGIEVPVKSVSQRFGVWQIPEMQIEMAADPVLSRMGAEDRMQVVVFDLDDVIPDKSELKPQFRLFGEGEIAGWGYQNTPSGRSITFTAINQFAIFTQLFVQFLTNVDDMLGYNTTPGTVDTAPTYTSELIFPFSLFKQGLKPAGWSKGDGPKQDKESINRPFDFLYNIIRNMCGAVVPSKQQTIPAANFFARWARLTNFVNRFAGCPSFDEQNPSEQNPNKNIFPILKALQNTSAVDVVTHNLIAPVQNKGSILDMLQLVYQTMFMEIAMIPTMPLVSVKLDTNIVQETPFEKHTLQEASTKNLISSYAPNPLAPDRIQNYFPKPQFLFGLPPSCNVFFPSQIKMFQYGENYAVQPTRLYFNDEVLNRVLKMPNDGLGQAIMNSLSTAYPPEADAANKVRLTANSGSNGKNFLLFPEEFFKGPVLDRRPIPTWLYFLKHAEGTGTTPKAATVPMTAEPGKQDLYEKLKIGNPDVYRLYAEYEFFRERYSRRTGSIILAWNPYVVPGFPMAVFDQRATRVDLFAYITTVQQSMTHRSRSTTVSFMYARTVQEMFDIMARTFREGSPALATGPREPITEIRKIIQSFGQAEAFYRKLFYGDRDLYGKNAAFDWREVIAYAPQIAGQKKETIFVNGGDEKQIGDYYTAQETFTAMVPMVNKARQDYDEAGKTLETLKNNLADLTKKRDDQEQLKSLLPILPEAAQAILDDFIRQVDQTTKDLAAQEIKYKQLQAIKEKAEQTLAAAQEVLQDKTVITQTKVLHNLVGDRELVPTDDAVAKFASYDEAMKYNWRPRCTLDEYIIFYNSIGEGEVPAFGRPRSIGARYFERIRSLKPFIQHTPPRPDIDTVLPKGADGLDIAAVYDPASANKGTPAPVTGTTSTIPTTKAVAPGLPADFPQTRLEWDKVLLAYRENVYNVLSPRT